LKQNTKGFIGFSLWFEWGDEGFGVLAGGKDEKVVKLPVIL